MSEWLIEAEDLMKVYLMGEVEVPPELVKREVEYWGGKKGTYGISEDLREWLRLQLN